MDSRKFYKINGLSSIFKKFVLDGKTYFNTDVDGLLDNIDERTGLPKKIDEQTVLFIKCSTNDVNKYIIFKSHVITPSSTIGVSGTVGTEQITVVDDARKINENDTLIWVRGTIYSFSDNGIVDIYSDTNNGIVIKYADGKTKQFPVGLVYTPGNNIDITDNVISAIGYLFDKNDNFIENPGTTVNDNRVAANIHNAHVDGIGNKATRNGQHICGTYNVEDSDKTFIVAGGTGNSYRKNFYTIDANGKSYTLNDVTCGNVVNGIPAYKLSDIHSVLASDWIDIEN